VLIERLKGWLGLAAFGAALALVAAIVLGPGFIAWRYEAPGQETLSCGPAVRSALGSFARFELYAAGVGGVIGFVLALVVGARKGDKKADASKGEPLPPPR
jgi:hypothetical protein